VTNAVLSPFRAITTTQNFNRPEDEAFKKYGPLLQGTTPRSERGNVRGVPYTNLTDSGTRKQPTLFLDTDKSTASSTGFLTNLRTKENASVTPNGLDNQPYSHQRKYTAKDSKFLIQDARTKKTSTVYSGGTTNPIPSKNIIDKTRGAEAKQGFISREEYGGSGKYVVADISMLSPKFDERYVEFAGQTIDGTKNSKTFATLVSEQKPYFEYAKKFTDGYTAGDNAGIAKNQYTGSIPLDASGSFTDGTGKTVYGLYVAINAYTIFGPTVNPKLEGKVQGVVVQAI
jgi:hypothetical protein